MVCFIRIRFLIVFFFYSILLDFSNLEFMFSFYPLAGWCAHHTGRQLDGEQRHNESVDVSSSAEKRWIWVHQEEWEAIRNYAHSWNQRIGIGITIIRSNQNRSNYNKQETVESCIRNNTEILIVADRSKHKANCAIFLKSSIH